MKERSPLPGKVGRNHGPETTPGGQENRIPPRHFELSTPHRHDFETEKKEDRLYARTTLEREIEAKRRREKRVERKRERKREENALIVGPTNQLALYAAEPRILHSRNPHAAST